MAVAFNGTSSKLTFTGTVPSGLPVSVFGWVKLNATGMGKVNVPFGFGQGGVTRLWRAFIDGTGTDQAVFQVNDGGGSESATSTSAAAQDVWMPLLITHAGSTIRIYFRSGATVSQTIAGNITWSSANRFTIGFGPHADEHFLAGEMTRVCVWTRELLQADFDSLANTSTIPNMVQASDVWDYWSLSNSSALTGVNGRTLTAVSVSNGGTEPDGSGGGPSFTTQPSNQTVTAPGTASFSWASSGTITGFQVQQRRGGGAWNNVPDGTGASGGGGTNVSGIYTTTATAVSTGNHRNGDEYRVVLNPSGTPVNSNAATLTVTEPTATQLVLSVPDAAGLSGFNGLVLSAAAPGSGVTVIATPTGISFNGAGQATINVTGLGIPVGARRWVSVTNSTGDPAQSPAPVQAQGPVTAS